MLNSSNTINGIAKEVSKLPNVCYLDDVQLSDGLLDGTIKSAAVIACSDMGWLVPYVCSSDKVQLELFQNFGHRFNTGGLVETIIRSDLERVIVYGHSVCEYTRFRAQSVNNKPESCCSDSQKRELETKLYSLALESDNESLWSQVGQFNVLNELMEMLSTQDIQQAIKRKKFSVHGWFYRSKTQQLEVFEPEQQKFIVPHTQLHSSLVMKFVPDQSHVRED